jgi:hypothetical protein
VTSLAVRNESNSFAGAATGNHCHRPVSASGDPSFEVVTKPTGSSWRFSLNTVGEGEA